MKKKLYLILLVFVLVFFYGLPLSTSTAHASAKNTPSQPLVAIKKINYKKKSTGVKIEIPVSRNIDIRYNRLKNPDRLYVDFLESQIGGGAKQWNDTTPDSSLIKKIRIAQNRPDRVRVVFYLVQGVLHEVFMTEHPAVVTIEITGKNRTKKNRKESKSSKPAIIGKNSAVAKKKRKTQTNARRDRRMVQKKIVIDPGHGGKDPGAIGRNGLMEKDVALDISKRLARILRKKLGCKVILTREKDRFVPIPERTKIAKKNKADLFISIHINADNDHRSRGIETYYLSPASSKRALKIAARENMVTLNNMEKNDLQFILADLASTHKINESIVLANHVQRSLIKGLKSKYKNVRNLGVKKAPFYVLVNTQMPSVLIEAMFITNREEEKRLRSDRHKEMVASSVFEGIKEYLEETVVAFKSR